MTKRRKDLKPPKLGDYVEATPETLKAAAAALNGTPFEVTPVEAEAAWRVHWTELPGGTPNCGAASRKVAMNRDLVTCPVCSSIRMEPDDDERVHGVTVAVGKNGTDGGLRMTWCGLSVEPRGIDRPGTLVVPSRAGVTCEGCLKAGKPYSGSVD